MRVRTRRAFLALLSSGLASLLGAGAGVAQEVEDAARDEGRARPNVLFLAIDDLNDWLGALGGHPDSLTPHIDALARRGVLFTRAYCSAPACNPSRASLLTGRRPSSTGVYQNNQPWRPALPDAVTLPQHFRAAGYKVHGGGKIFHGGMNDPQSWDEYLPRPADPLPEGRPLNGIPRTAHFDWGPVEAAVEEMGDANVVEWARAFLEEEHAAPFFLAVGLYRPHLPWYVPSAYFERLPPAGVSLPPVPLDPLAGVPAAGRRLAGQDHARVLASGNWARAVRGYLASIAFADDMVGRLLAALDASRYGGNTVIVVWGDHGWHLGEKAHWRKFALWEEATRVPLAIVAPGVSRAETRCARTVSLLDLYPTLVELCGLPPREELEGRSLIPLLREPAAAWDRPVVTTHGHRNHAVRTERWRYIRYADGSEELYDHDADPLEWENLAGESRFATVKEELARSLPKRDAPPAPRRQAQAAEEREEEEP